MSADQMLHNERKSFTLHSGLFHQTEQKQKYSSETCTSFDNNKVHSYSKLKKILSLFYVRKQVWQARRTLQSQIVK